MPITLNDFRRRLKLRLAMGDGRPSPDAVLIPRLDWIRNPTQQAFLRAIGERPNDAAPRLIYADWLEDNGNPLAAHRMRWFVNAVQSADPDALHTSGALNTHLGNTAQLRKRGGVENLIKRHGPEGANVYTALVNRVLHNVSPIDWEAIHARGPFAHGLNYNHLRTNLGGIELANELMSLGAMPSNFARTVERAGEHIQNDVNRYFIPVGSEQATPFAGHVLALHKAAHAATTHALNIGGGLGPDTADLNYPSDISVRRTGNTAAARHAENAAGVLSPQVFNMHVQQNNNIASGLATHEIWNSFPKAESHHNDPEQFAMTGENKLRTFLRLPLKLAAGESTPMAESFTPLEKQKITGLTTSRHTSPIREYREHVAGVHDPEAKPFHNVIPHVRTLTTVAQLGSPARGEYEATANAVRDLFAHDPEGITAWMGLNGVFSPQTAYKHHAGAASMLTAAWLNAKKPRDEHTIRRLIEAVDAFGKHYDHDVLDRKSQWDLDPETRKYSGITPGQDETFGGTMRNTANVNAAVHVLQNTEKLWEALHDPTGRGGQNLEMLGGQGISKVPNFVLSYFHPMFGTALDTHMSRLLLHPDLDTFRTYSPILRQIDKALPPDDRGAMSELRKKSLEGVQIKSDLVKLLMKHPMLSIPKKGKGTATTVTVSNWLKDINGKLLAKPQHYLAYKYAINEAAKNLGWTPAEVQESVWTGVLALMAAKTVGVPGSEIQKHLTADTIRKGWQNHESIYFPKLVDTLIRGGANPQSLRKLGKRLLTRAAESSRPGVLRVSHAADLPDIAAHLPTIAGVGHAARPIADALRRRLTEFGLIDPKTGKYRLRREGEPLRLMAQYDRPLDFGPSLDRISSVNQQPLIEGLKQALIQSGVNPQHIAPAIHDYSGMTRASVLAIGQASNPTARSTGTAWTGLLGRQPGMVAFTGNPRGKDSVYVFHHHNAEIVRNVLQQAGVTSRTIVPHGTHYKVYVYDPGNKVRSGMAQALAQLGAQATEWRGDGKVIGGDTDDMGRAQYRDTINRAESAQFARMPSELELLLRRVVKKPRDDARWLVLADRFEEEGKPHTAAFLRRLTSTQPTLTMRHRSVDMGEPTLPQYTREISHVPGGMYRFPYHPAARNDVISAYGGVGPLLGTFGLYHGLPKEGNPPVMSTDDPRMEGIQPYGTVNLYTNKSKAIGRAEMSVPEFHGIVEEASARPMPHSKRMQTFHGASYWDRLRDRVREVLAKKQQPQTERASEPPEKQNM